MSHQYVPNLGSLCGPDARRDAVHVPLAPVVAGERLAPGTHVLLDDGGRAVAGEGPAELRRRCPRTVGVVDPFLGHDVEAGQAFWLALYPNTVTGLRHSWSHPAFKARVPLP